VVIETVFPTHVGVNRPIPRSCARTASVPHARGGEPLGTMGQTSDSSVFPTHVGVNRNRASRCPRHRTCSPRTWG